MTVSGGTLKITNPSSYENSSLTNGKLDGEGDITITGGSNLLWSGGSIEGSGSLIIENNAKLYANASSSLDRYLVNNGSLLITDSLRLTGGAEGSGNFNIQESKTLELSGSGAYNLSSSNISNMGTLRISNTCTSVNFNSDYTQQSTGTLEFDIGGLSDFTQLEVAGTASLNGILKINILDGYNPSLGDTFEIMTCGSRAGTFSSIESNMPEVDFVPTYTDTGLTLTVSEAASVTVPTAPQNFTATPGDTQVALSWTAPASDGGAAITHYEVSADDGTWVTASTSTSHTFTGLTNGTEYTFKVRAVNSEGPGAEASVTATPTEYVCEIGATKYTTLDDALTAVTSGQTIKLLEDIAYVGCLVIEDKNITFDLNGHDLNVDNPLTDGSDEERTGLECFCCPGRHG